MKPSQRLISTTPLILHLKTVDPDLAVEARCVIFAKLATLSQESVIKAILIHLRDPENASGPDYHPVLDDPVAQIVSLGWWYDHSRAQPNSPQLSLDLAVLSS